MSILKESDIDFKTVCDVGCGIGEILHLVQANFSPDVEYAGYDISPHAIELSKSRENDKLKFYCGNFLATSELYDLILCIDVFEHIPDYIGFLNQLGAHGENFVFHIPLDLSVQTLLRSTPLMKGRETLGHLHFYWKDHALAILKDAGYDVIKWQYVYPGTSFKRIGFKPKRLLAYLPRYILQRINPDLGVRVFGGATLLVLAKSTQKS